MQFIPSFFSHAKTPPITRSMLIYMLILAAVTILLLAPDLAHASTSGGSDALPWESPLTKFVNSLKGPVAFVISLCALMACFYQLMWGGEMSEFSRKSIFVVMGISGLAFATSLLSNLFGLGAVVV